MQAIEYNTYEDVQQHYVQPSHRIRENKAEDPTGKCGKMAMRLSCVFFILLSGGIITTFALHFESQGTRSREIQQLRDDIDQNIKEVNNDSLNLRSDTELFKKDAQDEREQIALALKSMNESVRSLRLELNAELSEIKLSQDNQNTNVSLVLEKLLGWEKSEHVIYKYFRQVVNYGTARILCAQYPGGRLAAKALRDPQVVSNILSKGYLGTSDNKIDTPWIGYEDTIIEGDWKWSDGGNMNLETTWWTPNQPDNAGGKEDCGQIWYAESGKLYVNDYPCDKACQYICEVDK